MLLCSLHFVSRQILFINNNEVNNQMYHRAQATRARSECVTVSFIVAFFFSIVIVCHGLFFFLLFNYRCFHSNRIEWLIVFVKQLVLRCICNLFVMDREYFAAFENVKMLTQQNDHMRRHIWIIDMPAWMCAYFTFEMFFFGRTMCAFECAREWEGERGLDSDAAE